MVRLEKAAGDLKNYRWEVYTPVEKRKYGYYVLPVLYNGKMVARFEPYRLKDVKEFKINGIVWYIRICKYYLQNFNA